MNKFKNIFLISSFLIQSFFSSVSNASNNDLLQSIPNDIFGTCKTKSQIRNARTALTWLKAFESWTPVGIKVQSDLLATEFAVLHSSLSALAAYYKIQSETEPNEIKREEFLKAYTSLPFNKTGQLNRKNYASSLAFIAKSNDTTQWKEIPLRVDCLNGSNVVVVDIGFSGFQVKRDVEGYITHAIPYAASALKVFTFNNSGKIIIQTVGVDSATSQKARMNLSDLIKKSEADPATYPPLPKNEFSKGTYANFEEIFLKNF